MSGTNMIDSILILSAGKGERLGKLTESIPKPLLEIESFGSTIIDRLLRQCRENFQEVPIYVNISYLAQNFLEHFSQKPIQDRPRIIFEQEPLGPSKSLIEFQKFGYQSTLIIHGDLVLSDLEFFNFASKTRSSTTQITVCHKRSRMHARSCVHSVNGRIFLIEEYDQVQPEGTTDEKVSVCSGLYLIQAKSLINYIPELHESLSPGLLNYSINKEETIQYDWEGWRYSIDSPETYLQCRKFLNN